MKRRETLPLSEILQECLRENGLETPLLHRRIIDSWAKVMGKTINGYTGDKFIKNQTLFVKIYNPALRANLSMMRERIVENLNKEVGSKVIYHIKFF